MHLLLKRFLLIFWIFGSSVLPRANSAMTSGPAAARMALETPTANKNKEETHCHMMSKENKKDSSFFLSTNVQILPVWWFVKSVVLTMTSVPAFMMSPLII